METQFGNNSAVSAGQLLAVAEALSLSELEQLTDQMLALRARRRAPHLSADETALLARINQTLPSAAHARLRALIAKRDLEELTDTEYAELTTLTDQLEILHADRLDALATLAQLRGVTLPEIMQQLGLRFPDHD